MALKWLRTRVVVLLVPLVVACRDPDQPEPLYDGEWIDILGVGRTADETCVGTFEYVDAYAGVLAAEFGLDVPLGTYVWYTPEDYDELLPCSADNRYPSGCANGDSVQSPFIPHVHEIVHVANFHTGLCPAVLAEGLAVYYSTDLSDGHAMDFDVLASHLAAASGPLEWYDYEMLGRFAAFLVDEYGLAAVLDVCAMAGSEATGAQLSEAMQAALGASPDELVAALSEQPSSCNDFSVYESKVFACGGAAAAQHLGVVEGTLETTIEVGCDRGGTVPTLLGDEIQQTLSFDAAADDYSLTLTDEATQAPPLGASLYVSRCAPCESWAATTAEYFPLITVLDAGRHALRVTLPADYIGTLRVTIAH